MRQDQYSFGAFCAPLGRSGFKCYGLLWVVSEPEHIRAALQHFGASVRRERIAARITQEQLAELTDLHLRTVQKIEAGNINVLITTAQSIQAALRCPWEKLLG
jgi:DNA-binding XRE family transcriptional regulator